MQGVFWTARVGRLRHSALEKRAELGRNVGFDESVFGASEKVEASQAAGGKDVR